ncbi:hypothetical protein BH20VER2_BH20VER2_04140 [soil metagenome]
MKETSVQLDEEVISVISECMRADQTLKEYVREALLREARAQSFRRAAETYQLLLNTNPDEQRWMDEWEEAALA